LGWWSNRVGILSYALTPFTVLLATRENLLTILTGIPYQHFNFLHRWLGRVIFIQGMLHTIGWTVVEAYFYKPSPLIYVTFLKNMYAVFGCVAVFFICFLTLFSLKPVIRWTGYEFFKLTHSIAAVFYLGAIWGHWDKLWCWIVASFVLIVLDQGARMIRTCYIHFGGQKRNIGFRRARAEVQVLGEGEDVVVRLDFDFEHDAWAAGQHFYLCFPSLSIWQSHPFTVVSAPQISRSVQRHTYILRPRSGLTAGLVGLHGQNDVAVVLSGPYGPACPGDITETTENVLAVGGGTGVTFTLPIAIAAVQQFFVVPHPFVDFVWVIRHAHDLLWLETELTALKAMLSDNPGFRIHIFVTRDQEGQLPVLSEEPRKCPSMTKDPEKGGDVSVASLMTSQMSGRNAGLHALLNSEDERFRVEFLGGRHPSMGAIVDSFMEGARKRGGYAQVFGSGPEAMGSDLRSAVAEVEEVDGLRFYWDSRD
jgi:ferric-chelate reductase